MITEKMYIFTESELKEINTEKLLEILNDTTNYSTRILNIIKKREKWQ